MSDQLKIQIGQRIKATRNLRGYTQEKLSELADCHIDSLSLIERGRSFPSIEILMKLSSALDVDVSALLNDRNSQKNAARITLEGQLWAQIETLSDVDLKKLLAIAGVISSD